LRPVFAIFSFPAYFENTLMPQGPDALRGIAASCLELAKTATDKEERALLVSYATAYHDIALQLERLASSEKDGENE
jgi:HD superfamily phosphohydrolase YqeK